MPAFCCVIKCGYTRSHKKLQFVLVLPPFKHKVHLKDLFPKRRSGIYLNTKMEPDPKYVCPICERPFSKSFNLRRHCQKMHSSHPKLPELLRELTKVLCHRCSKVYNSASRLDRHLRNSRNCQLARKILVFCWLCDDMPPIEKRKMIQHYAECHNIDMSVEKLNFDSIDDFEKWRQKMEIDTITKYIIDNHVINSTHNVRYFKCHRDGIYKPNGKNVRKTKHYKLNGHCPAKIRVSESLETGCVEVEFLGTHVGHDNRLDMIPKRSTNHSSLFASAKTEHDYCNEEASEVAVEVKNEGTYSDEDLDLSEDEGDQDPSSTESTSEEAEISEMKDRILQMVLQYLDTSTTKDQLEVIEKAVVSVGPVFNSLDGKEGKAPLPKRQKLMGRYIRTKLSEKLKP